MPQTNQYDFQFVPSATKVAAAAAEPVLRLVRDLYQPTSIVDIGCGSGGWLVAAGTIGFTKLRGYDGPWADPEFYADTPIDFTPIDLEHKEIEFDQRFDLAMSVEVAEHLSESRSDNFVDWLCAASDVVLFGAAIPGQGGTHHIHEMPQSYWVRKFEARGYEPFDIIRPAIWSDDEIHWWFRQNTMLYVKRGTNVIDVEPLRKLAAPIWDLVHPALYQARIEQLSKLQQINKDQERQLSSAANELAAALRAQRTPPAPRKPLRKVAARDLPVPLRPLASKAWRLLPRSTRARIRGRKASK